MRGGEDKERRRKNNIDEVLYYALLDLKQSVENRNLSRMGWENRWIWDEIDDNVLKKGRKNVCKVEACNLT